MMTYTILWLVAFLSNGDPVPYTIVLPEGQMCSDALAMHVAQEVTKDLGMIQDKVLWRCEEAMSPGPVELVPKRGL